MKKGFILTEALMIMAVIGLFAAVVMSILDKPPVKQNRLASLVSLSP